MLSKLFVFTYLTTMSEVISGQWRHNSVCVRSWHNCVSDDTWWVMSHLCMSTHETTISGITSGQCCQNHLCSLVWQLCLRWVVANDVTVLCGRSWDNCARDDTWRMMSHLCMSTNKTTISGITHDATALLVRLWDNNFKDDQWPLTLIYERFACERTISGTISCQWCHS